ncbi:MAG: MBL fold metallo-hydrolase [Dehalococcoidia bacterium]|jgi:ribonuclease BN (tRNA processing enzyme)|nr:MBL fold metallo-hydrolase [Dehalococcoidia bacterium]
MQIRILGLHNFESADHLMTSLVVDDTIALDAGSLTRALTTEQQDRVRDVMLTHRHIDHIRDVPELVRKAHHEGRAGTFHVYGPTDAIDVLINSYFGVSHPRLHDRIAADGSPLVELHRVVASDEIQLGDHTITPLPAFHSTSAVGYLVANDGRSLYYTGDTGPGFAAALRQSPPDLLLSEVTFPNDQAERASSTGHIVAATLRSEIQSLIDATGWVPRALALHLFPQTEAGVRRDIDELRAETGWDIGIGRAGQTVSI